MFSELVEAWSLEAFAKAKGFTFFDEAEIIAALDRRKTAAKKETLKKPKILFVCSQNSARSQMAAALVNQQFGDQMEAESAGLEPGVLNPLAGEAMRQVGIDISLSPTKSVFEKFKAGEPFAYVITVCDESNAERCPTNSRSTPARAIGRARAARSAATPCASMVSSPRAPMSGGEVVTKPLTFTGGRLLLNFASAAAGDLQVEVQDAAGKPLPGFAIEDGAPIFGDALERPVTWKSGGDVSALAGRPVRLRFVLKDADLYSVRFT